MQEPGDNQGSPAADPGTPQSRSGSVYRHIFHGVLELIELQARMAGLKILAVIQASFLRMCLFFLAVVTGLAGVVFLYIAVFQELDRFIPTRDVYLLFAMFQFLLAGGLWLAAGRICDSGARTKSQRNKPTSGGPDR